MTDADYAANELDRWISNANKSGVTPFITLAEKVSRHRDTILNSIKCRANSYESENCNCIDKKHNTNWERF